MPFFSKVNLFWQSSAQSFMLLCYFTISAVDTKLKIHSGLTSRSPLALHLELDDSGTLHNQQGSEPTFPIHLNSDNFYISLRGPETKEDHVFLAFSDIYSSRTSSEFKTFYKIFSRKKKQMMQMSKYCSKLV